jgi:hypothetical protein
MTKSCQTYEYLCRHNEKNRLVFDSDLAGYIMLEVATHLVCVY